METAPLRQTQKSQWAVGSAESLVCFVLELSHTCIRLFSDVCYFVGNEDMLPADSFHKDAGKVNK